MDLTKVGEEMIDGAQTETAVDRGDIGQLEVRNVRVNMHIMLPLGTHAHGGQQVNGNTNGGLAIYVMFVFEA